MERQGLNILLGVEKGDTNKEVEKVVNKIVNLRIFEFVEEISKFVKTQTGIFAADMKVFILNDGPVTFIIDSKEL